MTASRIRFVIPFASVALLCACLGNTPLMAATTYYVATDGSDMNSGRSLKSPFKTIKRAISAVNAGDTIAVRGGTYPGGLVIGVPGTEKAWITLKAYNKEKVVIDARGSSYAIYFYHDNFAPMYWTMDGIEARGGEYVIKVDTPYVKLLNNNFHGAKGDIVKLVKTAHHVVLKGNEIHHNDAPNGANAQGIDIVGSNDAYIAHNYVHDIASIGMYAKGGATNVVFEHNRVENIAQRGIMLGQSTDKELIDPKRPYETYDSVIRNNTVKNTGSACLATASSYNVKIYENTCTQAATQAHGAIFISNESELEQPGTNIEIRDNVIVADGKRPTIYIGTNALTDDRTLKIDGNRYWTAQGPEAVKFVWERGDNERSASFPSLWSADLKKWRRVTGLDKSSVLAAPASKAATSGRCDAPACDEEKGAARWAAATGTRSAPR